MTRAFTLIELVFVIVIIGILSTFVELSPNSSNLRDAANQVVRDIKYTQHLAMMDNKFDPSKPEWYKGRWQIIFGKSKTRNKHTDDEYTYSVFADKYLRRRYSGNPDLSELAINPLNPNQYMSGGFSGILHYEDERAMPSLQIGKKYGIRDIKFSRACSGGNGRAKRLAFDHLGRPLVNNISHQTAPYQQNYLLQQQCVIKLCLDRPCKNDQKSYIEIAVEPETGYSHVL